MNYGLRAAISLACGAFFGLVFYVVMRLTDRDRGGSELDGYQIDRLDSGDLRLRFTLGNRRRVAIEVDPRVAYRLADDLTRASMRAAPQKGGGQT